MFDSKILFDMARLHLSLNPTVIGRLPFPPVTREGVTAGLCLNFTATQEMKRAHRGQTA